MATYASLAHTCYADGYDLTGDSTALTLAIEKAALECTVFGPSVTSRSKKAGLEDVQAGANVYLDHGSGLVDPQLFANLGTRHVLTMCPSPTEAGRAYFFQAMDFTWTADWKVGEMATAAWAAQGSRGSGLAAVGAVAGYLAKAKGNVSATGALGTAKQLGAVSASQYAYGIFHVFSAGTTITVILESDDNAGFSSATTRATIGPLTTTGGTWMTRVAGAVTDDYWRFNVSAVTGTFSVAAAFGIK